MKAIRKVQSVILALLICTTAVVFFGCGDENYPITIGNVTFEESPEKIAVLSPNVADIVDCIGYNVKVACISENVITENLKKKTTCGSSIDPDTKVIIDSGATVVFADDNISDGAITELQNQDITVMQFHYENDNDSIATTYKSIGGILGGEQGKKKGETAFNTLLSRLEAYKKSVDKKVNNTTLLYLTGTEKLSTVVNNSWYNTLLDYTGAKVLSDNIENPSISLTNIANDNPDFLIYDSDTLKSLSEKSILKGCKILKKGNSVNVDMDKLKLQGTTAIENIKTILNVLDPSSIDKGEKQFLNNQQTSVNKESATTATQETTVTTTVATTTKPIAEYELESKYKVQYSDKAIKTMTKTKENKYIKAMQQRLCDLGYISKDNVTGYFGDVTEKSIKAFEKKNSLKSDGKVSKNMLKALFSSNAIKK
jgi:ABC-type Fe3+-hydroxamate transport system substrate-binding protein